MDGRAEAIDACAEELAKVNEKGEKLGNAASAFIWIDLAMAVVSAATIGISASQAPGDGAASVDDAVASERKFSPLEVVALVVGAVTVASGGATAGLGKLKQTHQTRANEIAVVLDDLGAGKEIKLSVLQNYCKHSHAVELRPLPVPTTGPSEVAPSTPLAPLSNEQ